MTDEEETTKNKNYPLLKINLRYNLSGWRHNPDNRNTYTQFSLF